MEWEVLPLYVASRAVSLSDFQQDAARFREEDARSHPPPETPPSFSVDDVLAPDLDAPPLQSPQRVAMVRPKPTRDENVIVSTQQATGEILRALMTLVPGGEERLQARELAAQERKQPVSKDDIVVTVQVFNCARISKLQEFIVLGSQPLSLLFEHIYCLRDFQECDGEVSAPFMYIDNIFYVDDTLRKPEDDARFEEWARTAPGYISGSSCVRSMQQTKISDLRVRIGAPQVLCHQGDCEHVIFFSDARVVQEDDPQTTDHYPLLAYQARIRRKRCRVCDIYPARWISWDDRIAPEQPIYYCEKCYASNEKFTSTAVCHKYVHE